MYRQFSSGFLSRPNELFSVDIEYILTDTINLSLIVYGYSGGNKNELARYLITYKSNKARIFKVDGGTLRFLVDDDLMQVAFKIDEFVRVPMVCFFDFTDPQKGVALLRPMRLLVSSPSNSCGCVLSPLLDQAALIAVGKKIHTNKKFFDVSIITKQ
jgi:hypothetical protein